MELEPMGMPGQVDASTSSSMEQVSESASEFMVSQNIEDKEISSSTSQEEEEEEEEDTDTQLYAAEVAFEEFQNQYGNVLRSLQKKKLKLPQYARRKLSEINMNAQTIVERATGLTPKQLFLEEEPEFIKVRVSDVRDKIITLTRNDICQILTLVPEEEWSINTTMKVFGVPRRLVEKARQERKENGILPIIGAKKGTRNLDEDVEKLVQQMYEDDEISRVCPGKNEYVTVKTRDVREQKTKRLLLLNLRDIYLLFKKNNPDKKISFSRFCMLRPKWCIPATGPGMHNVCVCIYHENVKLMLLALPHVVNVSHNELIKKMLCDVPNNLCYEKICEKCPGPDNLQSYLLYLFDEHGFDEEDEVSFNEWQSTGRTEIRPVVLTVEQFVQKMVVQLRDLALHNYIAKSQAQYLKMLKANMSYEECVIILDFAQNYSFVVQDEVQGFHWNNSQCTLHPICIYVRNANNEVICHSLCVISDTRSHDAVTVYAFLHKVFPWIKQQFPLLKSVVYFSDGAAGQYKNKFNFLNLCYHLQDFGLNAQWHFFATSHGKGPCDGVGGTVKRLVARASLQSVDSQILSARAMFDWCRDHINGVRFFYVMEEYISEMRIQINSRLSEATTVSGTRQYHAFIPISNSQLKCAKTSDSFEWHVKSVAQTPIEEISVTQPPAVKCGSYVSCYNLGKWWIGILTEIIEEDGEYHIQLLQPHGPSRSFKWPEKNTECVVPKEHILCMVNPVTPTGRQYTISEREQELIEHKLTNLKQSKLI